MDALTVGGMFLLGWLSGYLARVLKKIAMLVMGAQALFLLWLERQGIIRINYARIWEQFNNLLTSTPEFLIQFAPFGIPYACGFLLGVYFPRSLAPRRSRRYLVVREV